jgi:hypothetical protein
VHERTTQTVLLSARHRPDSGRAVAAGDTP